LLLRNEYLVAENRILRNQVKGRLLLTDGEKTTLAEIAKRLGRKALAEIAVAAKPDTILGWFRQLVARKFDGSQARRKVGRPRTAQVVEDLVVKMARENSGWGYDRIIGALANLGHKISDVTVGNIPKRGPTLTFVMEASGPGSGSPLTDWLMVGLRALCQLRPPHAVISAEEREL
jgi:hypothetical protein